MSFPVLGVAMKKILFVIPMHITWDSFTNPSFYNVQIKKKDGKSYNIPRTDLPLGPLSMSAYLKKHTPADVRLIDFNAEMNALEEIKFLSFDEACEDFFRKMEAFQPDIVGISSLFSPSYDNFIACAKVARRVWPESIVIGGGNIPTNSYQRIYIEDEVLEFDGLCYGEGEKPLLELVTHADPVAYLEMSSSWITARKIVHQSDFKPEHNFIEDLDEIPFFDYELCDFKKHEVNQVVASYHNLEKTRGFHVMTSRGCPFLCTFCASHRTHGRSMRYHSLERVADDFRRLKEQYNAETIIFQDDHLMADSDRVYRILDVLKGLGLQSVYQNGLTLYALNRQMLEAFYGAGVRHLVLPVESGSEKVLKQQMKKPLKMRISRQVASDCRDLGIYTNTNILIGMPGETKFDLEEARLALRSVVSNWFNIAIASPIVGSEMHEVAVGKGYIDEQVIGSDYRTAVLNTEDFSAEFIQEYQYFMNLDLNFVHNSDLLHMNWEWAAKGFRNVLRIKSDHAFAHYYLAKALDGMMDYEQAEHHRQQYLELVKQPFWGRWAFIFELEGISPGEWKISDQGLLQDILAGAWQPPELGDLTPPARTIPIHAIES